MFSLNYIKAKARGENVTRSTPQPNNEPAVTLPPLDSYKYPEVECDAAISQAMEYISPLFNSNFLAAKTNAESFQRLFFSILNLKEIKPRMCETPLKPFKPFNLRLVYNIIGLLIDQNYIRNGMATQIDNAIKESRIAKREKYPRRREEITNYSQKGYNLPYCYIARYELIKPILDFLQDPQ